MINTTYVVHVCMNILLENTPGEELFRQNFEIWFVVTVLILQRFHKPTHVNMRRKNHRVQTRFTVKSRVDAAKNHFQTRLIAFFIWDASKCVYAIFLKRMPMRFLLKPRLHASVESYSNALKCDWVFLNASQRVSFWYRVCTRLSKIVQPHLDAIVW